MKAIYTKCILMKSRIYMIAWQWHKNILLTSLVSLPQDRKLKDSNNCTFMLVEFIIIYIFIHLYFVSQIFVEILLLYLLSRSIYAWIFVFIYDLFYEEKRRLTYLWIRDFFLSKRSTYMQFLHFFRFFFFSLEVRVSSIYCILINQHNSYFKIKNVKR